MNVHDLGQGIAKILDQREKHYFGTYQFVSTPKPLNFVEAMQIVSEECGANREGRARFIGGYVKDFLERI